MKKVVPTPFPSDFELTTVKQLGEAVRAARTKYGMTLVEAAMSLNVSKQTLSDLELGKPTVSIGYALNIAISLGVSLFIVPAELKNTAKFVLERM